ncbi:MAG: hypothetical protein ALECFALPRED_006273 [Alectoria fallacina]|uniref:Uncharacterized protein n=1 Tax=Alectoria fallacina TaxID=1903189 RepID=A0A8H3I236_9LECA|nr:MAG: hypothetical protein ALECFALPRED_006273 [Alectoria fallacina]
MAQQPATNETIPLSAPDPLHPTLEQRVEGRDPGMLSISLGSKAVIQPRNEAGPFSSFTSPRSSIIMQPDHEDENMPLLLSALQHSTVVQQNEGRGLNSRAIATSPRVDDESTQPVFPGSTHSGPEQQHEHNPSSPFTSGELSPKIQYNVGDNFTSNTFAQQIEIQQHRPFSLFDPTQSSIMLRRNAHAESASAGRSSTSQESMKHVNPQHVRKLVNSLGFDHQLSEMFYKLVIATAPFHKNESSLTPSAPEESNPTSNALREALGNITFAPKPAIPPESPKATTAEESSLAGSSAENPTGRLLFDTNAAKNLGSRPLEPRSDSPPLLWSTAAAEESLDPNAEDPTYFTVAEFINTIVEKGIQVESVTDQDWWIEEMRVAILNCLEHDGCEEDLTAEEDSKEAFVTKEDASEEVKAVEDTSESDLQRWKGQSPDVWLKRDDGTDMNEEEIDEECARWDAMVRKARNEKEAKKLGPSLGKNLDLKDRRFWDFVRSSKQKEQTQASMSTHGQDEKAAIPTHDQNEKASQTKDKKGSRKNKNRNRKAKRNALKGANPEDVSEEVLDTEVLSNFLDLPTEAKNRVLGFVLVVDEELVPYHYVKGKIVKNVGLRKKPALNIMLALCSSKNKKVKECLDIAKNILYRDNTFSIRKPNDFIMFLGTIGGDNVARMKMGKNLLLTDTFFDKRRQYVLEMKWLARWGKDLIHAMKGYNIFRSDIVAENLEDDLTCEPTDIEKALKSMVEVMNDEGMMYEMLKEDGSSPMRLQSLDFGEKFDSLAEQINTTGLALGDGKDTRPGTAKTPEMEDAVKSISEKWKQKAREAGKKVEDEGLENAYGNLFLEMVTSVDEEEEEDIYSLTSGFYTPSAYSEHDEAGGHKKATSESTATLDSDSELEREILDLMDASPFGASE